MARIKPFKAAIPKLDRIIDKELYFDTVKENFPQKWAEDFYESIDEPAFYIYEIRSENTSQTGLLATVDIRDYLSGLIVRHEKTLAVKRNQMLDLFFSREAHIKPTLLVYKDKSAINKLVSKCKDKIPILFKTNFKNAVHIFWKVSDKTTVDKFISLFRDKVPLTYIADGHHRTEATAILYRKVLKLYGEDTKGRPYQRILCALYSSNQLAVYEFNRVIKTLNNYSQKGFKAELRKYFIIEKQVGRFKPASKNEIGMFISRKWYKMTPKPDLLEDCDKLVDRLDVSILNKVVLENILEIKDITNDPRVSYVDGPKGSVSLEKRVGKNQNAVAFSLFPVSIEDLMEIADAQETMPPKSTWFEPRMRNGFIVCHFSKIN